MALEPAYGEALLYSIESQKIKIYSSPRKSPAPEDDHDDHDRDTMDVMQDKMAEAREGEVRLVWSMSVCDFRAGEPDASQSLIELFSKAVICWEVKCVSHSNQVTTLCSRTLLPDACLPIGSYVSCSATIPKPPFRTRLEIAVKLMHTAAAKTTSSKTLRVNAFGLEVFAVPSGFDSAHVRYGGDLPVWSASSNALLGAGAATGTGTGADLSGGAEGSGSAPAGFVVARRVQWAGQHALGGVRLCFRSKLAAAYGVCVGGDRGEDGGAETSIVDSTWKMAEGSSIGYSWCLCRCSLVGGTAVVASGEVTQNKSSEDSKEEEWEEGGGGATAPSTLSDGLLQPWLWQDQDVLVGEAATNETFLLCVRVSSSPAVHNLTEKCKVQVSQCAFHVAGENYAHQKDVLYECQSNPTVLYSSFNNSSISISL